MKDRQNDEKNDRGYHQAETMQFVHKANHGENYERAESELRVSQKPVPSALDRSKLAVLFEAPRIDDVWGFDLERSFIFQNVLRIP